MTGIRIMLLVVVAVLFTGPAAAGDKGIGRKSFGKTKEGHPVELFTLTNSNGMSVSITNYGGIVTALTAPDSKGKFADVVLGFDNLDGYLAGHPYFGCIVGRYGNRIAKGTFTLDGTKYTLAKNNGPNHLHGGVKGFDKAVWQAEPLETKAGQALKLSHTSKDGEEGYPGTLKVTVTYTLTKKNELKIEYHATTDKATPVNLTNHSYFNLKGQGEGDILGHELEINADQFTPVDSTLIPTGELKSVEDTPLDFRKATMIGARIDKDDEQLKFGKGYDHNYVVKDTDAKVPLAARVHEPKSGRVLEVFTTEPGIQFYTGNFLDGSNTGKGGKVYKQRSAFCLETQHYPDSPNQPKFPSTILQPDQQYRSLTIYKFSAR
jgi:aldose 1-epimerase